MGSGEMTESMGKVYRAILSRIVGEPRAVFLDTPAGFQLNADEISQRAVEYFRERLGIPLAVASFKERSALSPEQLDFNLHLIGQSRLIFAGPGSPTYAVRQWKDHAIWQACAARVRQGAHLMMASAAVIAMSRHTLPVYEIYKVGEAPRWVDGLDLFGPYGLNLVLMPHWNNAEGGTHDTRFCFMGEPRLLALEQQLPPEAVILGLDEHTACIVDLHERTCAVMGPGGATVRHRGSDTVHPSASTFSLDELCASHHPIAATPEPSNLPDTSLSDALQQARLQAETQPQDLALALFALYRLAKALEVAGESEPGEAVVARAYLSTALATIVRAENAPVDAVAPYIDLLVRVRGALRGSGQWAEADAIRDGLAGLGIALEDAPGGTRWHRVN
jgi:cyanophycinase-like exopeptidase